MGAAHGIGPILTLALPWKGRESFANQSPTMKVYQAVANAFVKEGATTIFGLMGDGNMSWAAVMSSMPGVRMIDVRDEGAGTGAVMKPRYTGNEPPVVNSQR